MKRLLIPLLVLLCFTAGAQVVTPVTPQFTRKVPNDSILTAKVPNIALSFKLPDTSWVKKYTSTFFVHDFLNGTGTFSDPFGIANGYITPAMLHSISGVPGAGTVYYGDGHWGAISGGVANVSQGLHLSGDTVKLGGSITKDTVVTVTANHQFRIGDTPSGNGLYVSRASDSSMNVALGGGSQSSPIYGFLSVGGNGAIDIEAGNGSVDKSIQIDPTPSTGGMSIHDSDNLGLVNAVDYSTQIKLHPYALVQTNMLNARADSIISAVHNGDSTIYKVDGTLKSNRTVNGGGHNLTFNMPYGANGFSKIVIDSIAGINLIVNPYVTTGNGTGLQLDSGNFTLVNNRGSSNTEYHIESLEDNLDVGTYNVSLNKLSTINWGNTRLYPKGIEVQEEIDGVGLRYRDYHSYIHADSLTLMPKQYIDAAIAGISSGVTTFNTRTGAVSLLSSDVTAALGFTPENTANKSTTTTLGTSNTLYPSQNAVKTYVDNAVSGYLPSTTAATTYVPLTRNVNTSTGLTGGGALSADLTLKADTTLLSTKYYASTVVGVDGIVSGLVTTTVTTTATTTAGTYRLNNLLVTKGTSTNTTIPAQDATLNRYSLIVGDFSGTFTAVNGTLAADAVEPDIPTNKALIASIYIPATGGTVTTGGGGSGNGTVKNALNGGYGIIPFSFNGGTSGIKVITDTTKIQTITNFFPKGDPRYLKISTASTTYVPLIRTVNGKALSSNITLGLASSDFANQGTTTGLLHGNASGNPSFGQIVNADITNATIDLTTKVTGILPVANGGTGTSTPGIVAGTNVTVSGTWPNQTVNSTGGGGGGTYVGDESPTGSINSSNTSFTVSHTPLTGSLSIYYNGQRLISGTDYTLSGTTYTTLFTPLTGSTLKETYTY